MTSGEAPLRAASHGNAMSDHQHIFTGHGLDRANNQRTDAAWVADLRTRETARFLLLCGSRPLVRLDTGGGTTEPLLASARNLRWLPGIDLDGALFLGLDADGAPLFAASVPEDAVEALDGTAEDVRILGIQGRMPPAEIARVGLAKSLLDWHAHHAFCSTCGKPTVIGDGGGKRVCPACRREHFPRVDPVAITLVRRDGRCLLARQTRFTPNLYSALAGFIEPGESLEEAARREIAEEAGIRVGRVHYHSSQPWPFPSTLMIGCIGEGLNDEITLDMTELEDARWFTRDEAALMLRNAHPDGCFVPAPFAIGHHLIRAFASGEA